MSVGRALELLRAAGGNKDTSSPYEMAIEVLRLHGESVRGSKKTRLKRALRLAEGKPAIIYPKRAPVKRGSATVDMKKAFYASWDWRTLRMEVLKEHGHRCQSCGATPNDSTVSGAKVRIVVDHIKPLSKFWNLRLDRTNLQVLCDECNMGKGAWDETDYRPANDDEPEEEDTDPMTREWREIVGRY